MVDVPTRTLLDYLNSLPSGGVGGAVTRDLTIRDDLATGQQAVPPGGSTGEVLVKLGDGDFDTGWATAGQGTVQTVSIDTANGFAGASDGDPSNPTLTLSTTVTGLLKGNGTAISAATGGTDYLVPGGNLGTPSAGVLTNATGLPIVGGTTGTLPETRGGTNQTSYAQGDILYASATNTLSKLSKGSAFQNLRMNSAAAIPEWAVAREVLAANRTYYVRTDGSDSNNGLANTSGGAFLTVQKAVDVTAGLDLGGYTVTIKVGSGTYAESVLLKNVTGFAAAGDLVIEGDTSDDDAVLINPAAQAAFRAEGISSVWQLRYMKVQQNANSVGALNASNGSMIEFNNLVFGACNYMHIGASDGGIVRAIGNYAIDGTAPRHARSERLGLVVIAGRTITFRSNCNFSSGFVIAQQAGVVGAFSMTFTVGAFTINGKRYDANANGVINTAGGGASYFPGNSDGTTANGGVYI